MSSINEKNHNVYDYKPSEINDIIHKKHLEYSQATRDIKHFCPSCKSQKYTFAFDKYSFHYVQCQDCMSLYVQNPLWKDDMFQYESQLQSELYKTSKYNKYLEVLLDKALFELELTFSRFLNKSQPLKVAYFGNKSKVYRDCLRSFDITFSKIDLFNYEEKETYDLIILDHVVEKVVDLDLFIKKINLLLGEKGFLYATMRVGSGIDILTLWEDSRIYPIEHSNLLSTDGIKILLEKNAFLIKELNTPGVLDIDNILNTNSKNIPRFLSYLQKIDKKSAIEEFQSFIQKNLLSSFATVVAQRK